MNNLSSVLKCKRKELGLTLAQIADMMGVSEATVGDIQITQQKYKNPWNRY